MADIAQKEIEARNELLYVALNSNDFDGAVALYTENATFMAPDGPCLTGRQAIKEFMAVAIPPLQDLGVQKLFYFELFNPTAALTNFFLSSVDSEGKIKALLKDCLIWKKVEGEWYIDRDIFNARPLPSAED